MRAKSLQKLTDEMKTRFPGITIYGIGDEPHKRRLSDHNEDDTPGSRPAQSDTDSIPEHRAIDAMLGTSFGRNQARLLIPEILANPNNRKRLRYINFENTQWHRDNNFVPSDNGDDPHPDHIHFSGQAAEDDNTAAWFVDYPPFPGRHLRYVEGKPVMTGEDVRSWQARMRERGWVIAVDGEYGPKSAGVATRFQREKGLTVDGIVGPETWNAAWTYPIT